MERVSPVSPASPISAISVVSRMDSKGSNPSYASRRPSETYFRRRSGSSSSESGLAKRLFGGSPYAAGSARLPPGRASADEHRPRPIETLFTQPRTPPPPPSPWPPPSPPPLHPLGETPPEKRQRTKLQRQKRQKDGKSSHFFATDSTSSWGTAKPTPKVESTEGRRKVLTLPPRVVIDGMDTPGRSEWSEDSDGRTGMGMVTGSSRVVQSTWGRGNGKRNKAPKRRRWRCFILIGAAFIVALIIGLALGLAATKRGGDEDVVAVEKEDADDILWLLDQDVAEPVGLTLWTWEDGGISLFKAEKGVITVKVRAAEGSATTESIVLAGGIKNSALRLVVSQQEDTEEDMWTLVYTDSASGVLHSITTTAHREQLGIAKWDKSNLASHRFAVSDTLSHFQVCSPLAPSPPGEMAILFRAESGSLEMATYLEVADSWATEALPLEVTNNTRPAACTYEEGNLNVYVWPTPSTIQGFSRPASAAARNGTEWVAMDAYVVEEMAVGGDFHAVKSGNYTTLLFQDPVLDVRQLTLSRGSDNETLVGSTSALGRATAGTRLAGAHTDDDGLSIVWQNGLLVMEEELRAEVDSESGIVRMTGQSTGRTDRAYASLGTAFGMAGTMSQMLALIIAQALLAMA